MKDKTTNKVGLESTPFWRVAKGPSNGYQWKVSMVHGIFFVLTNNIKLKNSFFNPKPKKCLLLPLAYHSIFLKPFHGGILRLVTNLFGAMLY